MRRDLERLLDVVASIEAIRTYTRQGEITKPMVFDAVRIRLVEIGEAVKAIDPELLSAEPSVDWSAIARFRDQLTHHYWDTTQAVVEHVVREELDSLAAAAGRLRRRGQDGDRD